MRKAQRGPCQVRNGTHHRWFTRSHVASRRSTHSRPTDPDLGPVSPGQSGLTASFATRKSRVQIPPAPLNALVRAILQRARMSVCPLPRLRRPTEAPLAHGNGSTSLAARCFLPTSRIRHERGLDCLERNSELEAGLDKGLPLSPRVGGNGQSEPQHLRSTLVREV